MSQEPSHEPVNIRALAFRVHELLNQAEAFPDDDEMDSAVTEAVKALHAAEDSHFRADAAAAGWEVVEHDGGFLDARKGSACVVFLGWQGEHDSLVYLPGDPLSYTFNDAAAFALAQTEER